MDAQRAGGYWTDASGLLCSHLLLKDSKDRRSNALSFNVKMKCDSDDRRELLRSVKFVTEHGTCGATVE